MIKKDTAIFFGDLETYSKKYYEKNKYIKPYVFGCKELDSGEFIWDVDFKSWMLKLKKYMYNKSCNIKMYIHNLGRFDAHFLLPILFKNYNSKNIKYFIDKSKNVFNIKISNLEYKKKRFSITFLDSLKIWVLPVASLGRTVGLKKLDYGDYDILDEFKTNEDYEKHNNGISIEYFERDIEILRLFAIKTKKEFDIKDFAITIAGTAKKKWENLDSDILAHTNKILSLSNPADVDFWNIVKFAYRGGLTINNPKYQLKKIPNVHSYDVNSLYPSIMLNEKLPYGRYRTKEWLDKYNKHDEYTYKLYKIHIKRAIAKWIPFISIYDIEIENQQHDAILGYPKEIYDEIVYMNNYMLEFFKKHYDYELNEPEVLMYGLKEKKGMFDEYINYYKNIKENKEKYSPAEIQTAKLHLNSLYGKFGETYRNIAIRIFNKDKDLIVKNEKLYLKKDGKEFEVGKTDKQLFIWDEREIVITTTDGKIAYRTKRFKNLITVNDNILMLKEFKKPIKRNLSFIPIAECITTKSKIKLLDAIIQHKDDFIYADTDSIHLTKKTDKLELHDTNFGAWKYEGMWDWGIYRRAKHYYHLNNDGSYEIKGGGFNVRYFNKNNELSFDDYLQENLTVENGKTISKLVKGGILIERIDYNFSQPSGWNERKW